MNGNKSYITLLNELDSLVDCEKPGLSHTSGWLYVRLLALFNKLGKGRNWPESLTLSDRELEKRTQLNRRTLIKSRQELESKGLITTYRVCKGKISYTLANEDSLKASTAKRPSCVRKSEFSQLLGSIRAEVSIYSLLPED